MEEQIRIIAWENKLTTQMNIYYYQNRLKINGIKCDVSIIVTIMVYILSFWVNDTVWLTFLGLIFSTRYHHIDSKFRSLYYQYKNLSMKTDIEWDNIDNATEEKDVIIMQQLLKQLCEMEEQLDPKTDKKLLIKCQNRVERENYV